MITREKIAYSADEIKAMVKTCEKYKSAIERAQKMQENSNGMILKKWLWNVFPELSENKDERIRKGILELVRQSSEILDKQNQKDMIAWLEKKKQKLEESEESITESKPKPKFKVGDFITNNDITEHGEPEIFEVVKVCSSWYDVKNIHDGRQTMITFSQDYTCHLWTIDDAKRCDVNKKSDEKIRNATMAFLNGSSYDECITWLNDEL